MLNCLKIFSVLPKKITRYSNEPPIILRFISRKLEGFGLFELAFIIEPLLSKTGKMLSGFGLVTIASTTDF